VRFFIGKCKENSESVKRIIEKLSDWKKEFYNKMLNRLEMAINGLEIETENPMKRIEAIMAIFAKNGIQVNEEESVAILDFLYLMANIALYPECVGPLKRNRTQENRREGAVNLIF